MIHPAKPVSPTPDPLSIQNLVAFWDFQEASGQKRQSKGPNAYALQEMNGPVETIPEGVFGRNAAFLKTGQWFNLPRKQCPALNIHGKNAQVTVVAWVKRAQKDHIQCEAIAGMWNETDKQRQYCLFLNLRIWDSADQVCGHVSGMGGPTAGYKYCMDASIGATPVKYGVWECVAFSYDGKQVKSYLNGKLDLRPERNPYPYEEGLFDGGEAGADFTVGAVFRSGEMGNWFTGAIGGLAVYNRALTDKELEYLASFRKHVKKPN
jgi:hypothetical protein